MSNNFWKRIHAYFGGTFDPPHIGHLQAARGLLENPGVHRVHLLPNANPPLKSEPVTDARLRSKLTKLLVQNEDLIDVDNFEIKRVRNQHLDDRPSYTWHTLVALATRHPAGDFAFVIGADQFSKIERWHAFPDVLKRTHWIILERKPDGSELIVKKLAELQGKNLIQDLPSTEQREFTVSNSPKRIIIASTQAPEISSSELRKLLRLDTKEALKWFPEQLGQYLHLNGLYDSSGS